MTTAIGAKLEKRPSHSQLAGGSISAAVAGTGLTIPLPTSLPAPGAGAAAPAALWELPGLGAIRGLAAFYVFLHHAAHYYLVRELGGWTRVFAAGQGAVMIFFLLSGFVIYLSSYAPGRKRGFARYLSLRAFRIYPLFVVSLALGYGLLCWQRGGLFTPDFGQ